MLFVCVDVCYHVLMCASVLTCAIVLCCFVVCMCVYVCAELYNHVVSVCVYVFQLALEKEELRVHLQASKEAQRQLTAEVR